MKRKGFLQTACTLTAALLLLAACTQDELSDKQGETLPEGKYPMTFTATVDGLTATRVITTGSTTSWQEGDKVAISMDGGASHKQYKISDATSSGAMSPDGDANTLYWSKSQETLAAWHPVSCTIGTNTGNNQVSITNQSSGFGTLENILHAPETECNYNSGSSVSLTFRHALAKVKVTLQKGAGIEDSDLSNATVCFMGYTAGTLGYGGMKGSGDNGSISSKKETPADGGSNPTTYTALLIPQQMQGKPFIKVTIGTSDAARDYYYTPTGSTDANLEAGNQYSYTITVKKTGLAVKVDSFLTWDEGTGGSSSGSLASFRVNIPTTGTLPTITVGGDAAKQSDGYYTVASGQSFTITYDVSDFATTKGFPVAVGICDVTRTYTTTTGSGKYTFTYTNIRSDLRLAYEIHGEPDDFYCKDNSGNAYIIPGSVTLSEEQKSACVGIVFYKGNPGNAQDGDMLLGKQHPGCIHGLVVALHDANSGSAMPWSSGSNKNLNLSFYYSSYAAKGYSYTDALQRMNETLPSGDGNIALPIAKIADYQSSYPAPSESSGWYWPHYTELLMLHWNKDGGSSEGTTRVNVQLAAADGTTFGNELYWSSYGDSNGYPNSKAVGYRNNVFVGYDDGKNNSHKVRFILAF